MNLIREIRQYGGWTQLELSKRAATSQPSIAAYETGSKSPTWRTVERIAAAVGVHVSVRVVPATTREDRRSLAYHAAVAERLECAPTPVLARAQENLERWLSKPAAGEVLLRRWRQWLELPLEDLTLLMLDPGMKGRDMRQVSPFAGVLSAAERARILERFARDEAA